ncbi:hypothetical protein ACFPXP_18660 [Marinicrinis lubricantis]|uniref:Uncharacterized protein n=1 Tax=Marinicrinis lubricantis TaxID=2086470 RepID=A0ABW1ITJ8_9BACL
MDEIQKETLQNVILLPKTVEYYQFELTRMLETEKYAEAKELLRFLMECEGKDETTAGEWSMLLGWLDQQFPDAVIAEQEEVDETEEDLLKKHIDSKVHTDQQWVTGLLQTLTGKSSFEKKWIALEQLAHIKQKDLNSRLKDWVEQTRLHPMLQFKVLQTLKQRGARGKVTMKRLGETVELTISQTPLKWEDYPEAIQSIFHKVQEVCEVYHPSLAYFAEQTWKEFLSCIYGTAIYNELMEQDERGQKIWACALHYVADQSMETQGSAEEIAAMYQVYEGEGDEWFQSYSILKEVLGQAFSYRS